MAYAVIRTDRMYGTAVAPNLVSLKYMGAGTTTQNTVETEIENGNVVKLVGLMTDEREVYKGVTPAANTALGDIVLVAAPEVLYDERKKNLDEFINEAGKVIRGYRLHEHDIFSVTAEALSAAATIAVGNVVELQAGTKMKVVASATSGSTKVGEIIAIEQAGRYTYYVIEVK